MAVVGKAGSGKTFALSAAREAWAASGITVIGAAVARRAAHELEQGAGITATSVAALLTDLRAGGERGLPLSAVVVVDEAGMLGTRQLAELLGFVEHARGKLVLVGDHRQLPELEAGGAFRGLAIRGPAIALTQNRRQQQAWERAATDLLREGKSREAVEVYREHGALVLAADREQTLRRMVADWHDARDPLGAVMIAHRRTDVADLNGRAREVLRQMGELQGAELELHGGSFSRGDVVVIKRNSPRLGVRNGERGVVAAVHGETRAIDLQLRDRRTTLDSAFLDGAAHNGEPTLRHGYAITAYVAQGMTCRQAFVLGTDSLYREWGYTTMTRGAEANRLYVTGAEPAGRDEYAPREADPEDPIEQLVADLEESRAQTLASDLAARRAIAVLPTRALRAEVLDIRARLHEARAAGTQRLTEEIEDAQRALEIARSEPVRSEAPARRWGRLRPAPTVDGRARAQEALAAERVTRLSADRRHARDRSDDEGLAHPVSSEDQAHHALLRAELERRAGARVRAAVLDPPRYLLATLGPRPESPAESRVWLQAVARIEGFREDFNITDAERALGRPPRDSARRAAWNDAHRAVERSVRQLRLDERGIDRAL